MGFLRWLNTPRKGAGNQLFTCLSPSFREVSANRCQIELTLPPDYEVCWDFFLITSGSFEEAPRLFGYGYADVQLERIDRGGRFLVTIPERVRLLTRIRRFLTWPFAVRAVAGELKEANETLVERNEELEKTSVELAHYKTHLEELVEQRTAELRQARDELSATVQQLNEAQEVRERFFANISHEIRTPLSLILLAAADIEKRTGAALDRESLRGLGTVSDAARKLARLVDELLLLAAGQEDKLRIEPQPTDLGQLLNASIDAWRPAAEAEQLALAYSGPPVLVLSVDPLAIERVVSNLLSNAVKYTPHGGHIEVRLAVEENNVRLSVLDTGPGIDADLAGRLFGRFERAQGVLRRKPGTGIGLALVKELVEAHGGTVEAHGREPHGTEMRVLLPRTLQLHGRVKTSQRIRLDLAPNVVPTIPSGTIVAPKVARGTIVLAEDDATLAEAIAKVLADEFKVVVALDGTDAVALIREHQPHLLVTDIDMPGINGIELARRFRDETGDQLAPVVILSAVIDLGTRLAGLEAGAIDYVTKPFDSLELLARVRAQFRMRDLALRLHRAEQLSTLGILTAGLAHELRNPANGIVNAVPPLQAMLPAALSAADSGSGQLLQVISHCAGQIATLSRQLLGFREGALDLDQRPTRLDELVERAVTLSRRALDGVEVRKQITLAEPVRCAGPLFLQVLVNLIENAGHAAGKGGWIEIGASRRGARVTVEVADSGPGVPAHLQERVFEPFFTTKPTGIGNGLGLAVARAIVTRHGGVLEIRDRGPRRAFVIELPHLPADAV
ncbi:MAG TPA: HAMP domain-containing sensor histidine kinase [Kofleriaceae bacterium]|nr:HAMP domain-containing sensor histidine kinase [Kofleriaceae bacterium]